MVASRRWARREENNKSTRRRYMLEELGWGKVREVCSGTPLAAIYLMTMVNLAMHWHGRRVPYCLPITIVDQPRDLQNQAPAFYHNVGAMPRQDIFVHRVQTSRHRFKLCDWKRDAFNSQTHRASKTTPKGIYQELQHRSATLHLHEIRTSHCH